MTEKKRTPEISMEELGLSSTYVGWNFESSPFDNAHVDPGGLVHEQHENNESLVDWNSLPSPKAAWLLYGSRRSELDEFAIDETIQYGRLWTVSPRMSEGDTVFIYMVSPDKCIRYLARCISEPYWDSTREVNTARNANRHQWWAAISPIAQIEPISRKRMFSIAGQDWVMRTRGATYIPSEIANRFIAEARIEYPHSPDVERCIRTKVRRPKGLPDPSRMTLMQLKSILPSQLELERHVEEYVVGPLLRMCGIQADEITPQYKFGRKAVDFAVMSQGEPACLVEAKLRTHLNHRGEWDCNADFRQACGYAKHTMTPFLIIDNTSIYGFAFGENHPSLELKRASLDRHSLKSLSHYLCNKL